MCDILCIYAVVIAVAYLPMKLTHLFVNTDLFYVIIKCNIIAMTDQILQLVRHMFNLLTFI